MRVLIVRLSSMGDIVQTLPALTDAAAVIPDIEFDWVVDESFADIPAWHTHVKNVIVGRHRHWRHHKWQALLSGEIFNFYQSLRQQRYDFIIDVQTSWKSAIVTRLAKGLRCGYTKNAVREQGAQWFYQKKYFSPKNLNSLMRMRKLIAQALNYSIDINKNPDYGIVRGRLTAVNFDLPKKFLVFVHCASWPNKNWILEYWQQLIRQVTAMGWHVLLPWGNVAEQQRANTLVNNNPKAIVLPQLNLSEKAWIIARAKGLIGVDTGLSHMAAALNIPAAVLYGPTDPLLCGTVGEYQTHLMADFHCVKCHRRRCQLNDALSAKPPCFQALSISDVINWCKQLAC